jgi:hypothetical protein
MTKARAEHSLTRRGSFLGRTFKLQQWHIRKLRSRSTAFHVIEAKCYIRTLSFENVHDVFLGWRDCSFSQCSVSKYPFLKAETGGHTARFSQIGSTGKVFAFVPPGNRAEAYMTKVMGCSFSGVPVSLSGRPCASHAETIWPARVSQPLPLPAS